MFSSQSGPGKSLWFVFLASLATVLTLLMPEGWQWMVGWLPILLAAAAVMYWLDWAADRLLYVRRQWRDADAVTPKSKILDAVVRLQPHQTALLMHNSSLLMITAGAPWPDVAVRVGGEEIPFVFVKRWVDLGREDYLCPIRTWADGTRERAWGEIITNQMLIQGFAKPAAGNHAAVWVSRAAGLLWLGIQAPPPEQDQVDQQFFEQNLRRRQHEMWKADRRANLIEGDLP